MSNESRVMSEEARYPWMDGFESFVAQRVMTEAGGLKVPVGFELTLIDVPRPISKSYPSETEGILRGRYLDAIRENQGYETASDCERYIAGAYAARCVLAEIDQGNQHV